MFRRKLTTIILSFLLLASIGVLPVNFVASAGSLPTYTIDSCGVVINEPGYYLITQDLVNTGRVCIQVNTSNVVIDGAGHTLSGNSNDVAIVVYNPNKVLKNITVINTTIIQFYEGITLLGVLNGELSHLKMMNISRNGIGIGISEFYSKVISSHNIRITSNYINNSQSSQLSLYGIEIGKNSTNNTVANNTVIGVPPRISTLTGITYLSALGISVTDSHSNTITNNIIKNYMTGILVTRSNNTRVSGNNIYGARNGVTLWTCSHDNSVINNTIETPYGAIDYQQGVLIFYSNFSLIYGNEIVGYPIGLLIYPQGYSNKIINNNFSNILFIGISLESSFGYRVANTTIANNSIQHVSMDPNIGLGWGIGIQLYRTINTSILNNFLVEIAGTGISVLISKNTHLMRNYISQVYTQPSGFPYPITLGDALLIFGSLNNYIVGNQIQKSITGIHMYSSNISTILSNSLKNNEYGLNITNSQDELIYNNFFNNTVNIIINNSFNISFNISKTRGFNIVGGPYLGGNFWANPNGTGFSETCEDNDKDGICDSPCPLLDVPQIIDYLPLTYPPKLPDLTITSISVTTKDPATLEQVIDVSIANIGEDAAPAFNVVVLVNGTVVGNKTVNALSPGSTSELTFTWKASKEGFYVITAIADPGYPNDKVIESNESNNELTVNFTVGKYEEERPDGYYGRETFGVLFDLWNLWTAWFFKNFEELTLLIQTAQDSGIDENSIAEIHALNETGVQLIKEAWQTDDLNEIRAQMWKYVKSPVLWYKAREAYLAEKKAVELLKKILQME